MPAPTREDLLRWAEAYVALWNAGDKAAWIRNWKSVAPGEIRMLLENHVTSESGTNVHLSIETYRFEPDGSCVIRTFYRVPQPGEGELGALFDGYLPGR